MPDSEAICVKGGPPLSERPEAIRAAVKERFERVARAPGQAQRFPLGPASAKALGYDAQEMDALPPPVVESFCGVGNPLGLGQRRHEPQPPAGGGELAPPAARATVGDAGEVAGRTGSRHGDGREQARHEKCLG